MKNKLTILLLICLTVFSFSTSVMAESSLGGSTIDPTSIETKSSPAESYLSRNRASVGASTNIQTLSSPTLGLTRATDEWGWDDPFLPGEGGWETGETGNVGMPLGDVSFPILLSMLVIYFVYRGVSSTKRRNSF